ncbi:hypothetical protein CRG98_048024 [Punica granatum]|uniref:Uncharacterized protein n=1 Tax=Punica granatum TaxID=22663 RepID=A0A2I0HIR6_PUNGR|nr:hypothetical protein CRG98_048024 [Punica granatum]
MKVYGHWLGSAHWLSVIPASPRKKIKSVRAGRAALADCPRSPPAQNPKSRISAIFSKIDRNLNGNGEEIAIKWTENHLSRPLVPSSQRPRVRTAARSLIAAVLGDPDRPSANRPRPSSLSSQVQPKSLGPMHPVQPSALPGDSSFRRAIRSYPIRPDSSGDFFYLQNHPSTFRTR